MAETARKVHLMDLADRSGAGSGEVGWARYVEDTAPQGAQGTVRIAALLRIVAAHNAAGMKLNEIGRLAGLEQSTAHRIVSALHSVGFLSRDPQTRRYFLGPLLFELFTTAFPHFNIRDLCWSTMAALAEDLGDTVYLTIRSGFDGVCVERHEGSFPIRTCTVEVGQRRPLGVGAGSIALMSALRDAEIATVLAENAERYAACGTDAEAILRGIDEVRERGYVYQDAAVSSDVKGVALPIKGRTGHPFGALSMTAIATRMTPARALELRSAMEEKIAEIEAKITDMGYV